MQARLSGLGLGRKLAFPGLVWDASTPFRAWSGTQARLHDSSSNVFLDFTCNLEDCALSPAALSCWPVMLPEEANKMSSHGPGRL
jgi:hypothetical protein